MKSKETVPAVVPGLLPSTEVVDYGNHAGEGMDVGMSEMLIPFIGLLQAQSEELDPSKSKYIKGAAQGMIVNRATRELASTMNLVAAVRTRTYEEWVPREKGGGHVGTHLPESEVVVAAIAKAKAGSTEKYPKLFTTGGNHLVETFSLFCIDLNEKLEPRGFVIVPFSSSKIGAYKGYRTIIGQMKGGVPLFGFVATLSVVDAKNAKGSFKNFKLLPLTGDAASSRIPPTHPAFQAAVSLKEALEAGTAKADYGTAADEATEAESEDGQF